MTQKSLIPDVPIPESAINAATADLITKIGELIAEHAAEVANEWAETADVEKTNIFMDERVQDILASNISGFITKMSPRGHQFTDNHATAYLGIEPVQPAGKA